MKNKTKLISVLSLLIILSFVYSSCKKQDEKVVDPNTSPEANFLAIPKLGTMDTLFVFDASISKDKEDDISKLLVRWDIDGDSIWDTDWSDEKVFNYQYDTTGNYDVQLEVMDTKGLKNTTSQDIQVLLAPVANFTLNNTSGTTSSIFEFDASGSINGEGTSDFIEVRWDFNGDGEWDTYWSYDKIVTHQYKYPGEYEAILMIRDIDYLYDTSSRSIQIVNVGCEGISQIEYGGKIYNTVEIGGQCWLKENISINTGTNWIVTYDSNYLETYGRLYDKSTALFGACPSGWHLPSDYEWCILTSYVDPSANCDTMGWNGNDAGLKMKSTFGWDENGNGTDDFGFTALSGGYKAHPGGFRFIGTYAAFWTATKIDHSPTSYIRGFKSGSNQVYRFSLDNSVEGASVRCIKE
ncbi:MAG: hypothetical protein K9G58_03940 [Bacteroidales bacterium]|nr:hypothetical protein [Bacteroidales bacterium]MCF8387621.1 hypothetical protein [Bacteroidales bacterium]MCF8397296.1 hypothetical protein [Bacteroidales bacterium]